MKRALLITLALALAAGSFAAGHLSGVRHALFDSEIYTVTRYDPEAPHESAWNGFDQLIYIDLDGQTYEHGMFQG